MDQVTLVENQIDDGQRLIERLAQAGFPVTAAAWVKTIDDGQWFLYIVSPVVDTKEGENSYRSVHTVIRQMPQPFGVHWLEAKLIHTRNPLAKGIQEIHQRYPAHRPIQLGETQLGRVSIDGAYIYPPVTASV